MTPDARAGAEASLTSARGVDLLFANLETHCVVGSPAAIAAQLGVVLWHVLGCDARADDAAAEALANRLTRAGQQAPRRCRSRDRAGASFSPRISSQLDEDQASRRRWRDSCLPPTTRTPSGPTRSSPCRERRTPKIAKGRRPPSSRAGDCLRGEPIAALANTRTAEAIVRAIGRRALSGHRPPRSHRRRGIRRRLCNGACPSPTIQIRSSEPCGCCTRRWPKHVTAGCSAGRPCPA